MSVWVRPKGAPPVEGDGQICIAGPNGPIHRTVVDGAFEWPDELGAPHSRYEVTDPSPEARERRRQEQIEALEAEAERLGYRLAQLREQGVAPPPPTPPSPVAPPRPIQAPAAIPPIQAAARRAEMERQSTLPVRRR